MHGSIPRAANRRHPGIAAHPPQRPAIQAIIYRRCSSRRGDAGVQTYFGMLQFSTKYTLPKNTKNSKRLDWNYVFSPIPVTYIVRRANTQAFLQFFYGLAYDQLHTCDARFPTCVITRVSPRLPSDPTEEPFHASRTLGSRA